MREIVIIRHAVAFERDAKRWPDDRNRPLTRQGRQKFRAVAAGLARYIPEVDLLLTSPLRRARETAAILTEVAGWPKAAERRELEPGTDPTLTLASLTPLKRDRVALVSHEPLVSALLALCIAGPHSTPHLEFKKGAVALVRFPAGLRAGSATLLALRAHRRAGILCADELQRALRTQIAAALAQLKDAKPPDVNVHSARKWIKKARATVRLMRDVLGEATYRRENAALRDAAQQLSAARDLKVLIEALDALATRRAHEVGCASLRRILVSERIQLQKRSGSARHLASSRNKLRSVRHRALEWSTAGDDAELIVHALRRVYRRGRRSLAAARKPTAANLHEWRKETKYLWHQLELLEPLAPRKIGTPVRRLHKLSDLLGEDHDLAMLSDKARTHAAALGRTELPALLHRIDRRRKSLQSKAFALGKRSYKKSPSAFIRGLGALPQVADVPGKPLDLVEVHMARTHPTAAESPSGSRPPRAE